MEKPTKKQKEILDYIVEFIRERGYAPSYREVGSALGMSSTATVHEHVKNLEEKGLLRHGENDRRTIDVHPSLLRLKQVMGLPLKGLITAGEPIEAVETDETIAVPDRLVRKPQETYVLKVRGDSMIEDGILDGDFVIVEDNPSPRNGEVVVALTDNTYATLKRFYREKGRVRLQPANRKMKPIFVKDLVVQGVVRAVIRDYDSPSYGI